ncbi:MAG: MAPEG family protein [Caulobacter sp.]|nr:MAPEG family protein [Caulobacter sp.]
MTWELKILAWTLVLAFVQIILFDVVRTGQYGLKWNTGARDETDLPPLSALGGRLSRAQANLFETLPLFIAAVLIAHVADRNGVLTHWGTLVYLAGRVVYVPLYAFGVKQLRSLVWLVSIVGLGMVAAAILV